MISSYSLRCSLLHRETWLHRIAYIVHYYRGEHDFIRLFALFINTKRNVPSSNCVVHYYNVERNLIRLSELFIIATWNVNSSKFSAFFIVKIGNMTSSVCVVHYYKEERDFNRLRVHLYKGEPENIRLSALFIITKGDVNSSDCQRCSLLHSGSWLHQIVRFFFNTKGNVTSSKYLRCSLLQRGTRLHQITLFIITKGT